MSERYWYQDGWTVFYIVVGTIVYGGYFAMRSHLLYLDAVDRNRPPVDLRMAGLIDQSLLEQPKLVVHIWHQHPGVLRNGHLTVVVSGPLADTRRGAQRQEFSFGNWEPNQSAATVLSLPLTRFNPAEPIFVDVTLIANDVQPFSRREVWTGDSWLSSPGRQLPVP
jgi:hypothetical protein